MNLNALIFVVLGASAIAVNAADFEENAVLQKRLQELDQRYKDYHEHEARRKLFEKDRMAGALALKKMRKVDFEKREAARRLYIKNRKSNVIPGYDIYVRELEKEERARLQSRKNYVNHRKRVSAVEKKARHISLEKELDL